MDLAYQVASLATQMTSIQSTLDRGLGALEKSFEKSLEAASRSTEKSLERVDKSLDRQGERLGSIEKQLERHDTRLEALETFRAAHDRTAETEIATNKRDAETGRFNRWIAALAVTAIGLALTILQIVDKVH